MNLDFSSEPEKPQSNSKLLEMDFGKKEPITSLESLYSDSSLSSQHSFSLFPSSGATKSSAYGSSSGPVDWLGDMEQRKRMSASEGSAIGVGSSNDDATLFAPSLPNSAPKQKAQENNDSLIPFLSTPSSQTESKKEGAREQRSNAEDSSWMSLFGSGKANKPQEASSVQQQQQQEDPLIPFLSAPKSGGDAAPTISTPTASSSNEQAAGWIPFYGSSSSSSSAAAAAPQSKESLKSNAEQQEQQKGDVEGENGTLIPFLSAPRSTEIPRKEEQIQEEEEAGKKDESKEEKAVESSDQNEGSDIQTESKPSRPVQKPSDVPTSSSSWFNFSIFGGSPKIPKEEDLVVPFEPQNDQLMPNKNATNQSKEKKEEEEETRFEIPEGPPAPSVGEESEAKPSFLIDSLSAPSECGEVGDVPVNGLMDSVPDDFLFVNKNKAVAISASEDDPLGLGLKSSEERIQVLGENDPLSLQIAPVDSALEERSDDGLSTDSRFCSWCFGESENHVLMKEGKVSRNTYQCQSCGNSTQSCLQCRKRMVRCFTDGTADKICYVCSGISQNMCVTLGNCSWCLKKDIKFVLYRARALCRSEYICTKCRNSVNPCRMCKVGYARKQAAYAEQLCLKCDGTLKSWDTAEEEKEEKLVIRDKWCSWCVEQGSHDHHQWKAGGRTVYKCRNCSRFLVRCSRCDVGLTKRTKIWKDLECLSCVMGVLWSTLKEKKDAYYKGEYNVRELLEKMSPERRKARKEGLERPFLLLVSMRPEMRVNMAAMLDLTIVTQSFFGDPHVESWFLLATKDGIRDRSYSVMNRLNIWGSNLPHTFYDIIRIVAASTFEAQASDFGPLSWKENIDVCQNYENPKLLELEEFFFRQLIEVHSKMSAWEKKQTKFWAGYDDEEEEECITAEQSLEENRLIRKKLAKYAGVTDAEIARYGFSCVTNALGINTMSVAYVTALSAHAIAAHFAMLSLAHGLGGLSIAFGAVMGPWGLIGTVGLAVMGTQLALGSSEGVLLEPLIMILNQRFVLALDRIDIRKYHTFVEINGQLYHPITEEDIEEQKQEEEKQKELRLEDLYDAEEK